MMQPIRIAPARAWRTYRGGKLIDELHGRVGEDTHFPEEWILSTVEARNPGRAGIVEGLSTLAETGEELRAVIARDPECMLGAGRSQIGMLMKLIDAAERLSVQVHPTRADAARLFDSPYGKTECWHILGGRRIGGAAPAIYLGFRPGVTRAKWARLFHDQDVPGMLSCLHRMEVRPGETYLIRGGVPHAIGAGCFLAEIQEPTDLTLRVERKGPAGEPLPDASCHQGAGFEAMLDCFDYDGCDAREARRRWLIPPRETAALAGQYRRVCLLGHEHTPYFRLERLEVRGGLEGAAEGRYCGLYVLAGRGEIAFDQTTAPLIPGTQYFVPACAAPYRLRCTGEELTILRYEGPQTEGTTTKGGE